MQNFDLKIGFIGGGNMAQAIVGGLLNNGHNPQRIMVADPSETQRARMIALNPDIQTGNTNAKVAGFAEMLVLAVKPQLMADVARELADALHGDRLIVSIAAGIRLSRIQQWFGAAMPVVRVMPNQPALVGAGMSVLIASDECQAQHRNNAEYMAGAVGRSAWIRDESLMDAVTAISGSGPAYFYLLMEMMSASARDMGLSEELSRLLTRQTALGAGLSAQQSDEAVRTLRASVTSPGGTTAAALEVLEKGDIRGLFAEALKAAQARSRELGNDS